MPSYVMGDLTHGVRPTLTIQLASLMDGPLLASAAIDALTPHAPSRLDLPGVRFNPLSVLFGKLSAGPAVTAYTPFVTDLGDGEGGEGGGGGGGGGPGDPPPSAGETGHWLPVQIAADSVALLSNYFTDMKANGQSYGPEWNQNALLTSSNTQHPMRVYLLGEVGGGTQKYNDLNLEILTGNSKYVPGNDNGGMANLFPSLERWLVYDISSSEGAKNGTVHLTGSVIDGFNSVYYRLNHKGKYGPPKHYWSHHLFLDYLEHQPPGTPLFSTYAVRAWQRQWIPTNPSKR
jgi:hypothetical protein